MGKKLVLAMGMILAMNGAVFAQSKKAIREKKIVSTTVKEYFLEEGMDDPVVESIEKFNENGDLKEIQVFNKKEEVKKWEKYAYDADGNLVEEVFLDDRGRIVSTEKTLYREGLKTEKHYFNSRGDLYKKKVYTYEYSQ